jgi:hypothetical protein
MRKNLSVLAVGTLALLACTNPSATNGKVVLDVEKIDAPATIAASSPLDVVLTVTTGGCVSFDQIRVERGAGSASLTAFGKDFRRDGCLDIGFSEPHTFRIEPPFAVGQFTITVTRDRLAPLVATVQVQ